MNRFLFYVSLLSFGIVAAQGGIVFLRQPGGRANRSFGLLCLVMATAALAEAMLRGASDLTEARIWIHVSTTAWPFSTALMLLFCLVYTRQERLLRNRLLIAVLFLIPAVLAALNLTAPIPAVTPVLQPQGFGRRLSERSILLPLAALWGVLSSLAALLLLARHGRAALDRISRRQTAFIAAGFLMPLVAGIVTRGILPLLGIEVPVVVPLSRLWLALFVGYSMWRHELFRIDPAQAADPTLSVMKEAVLLLDAGGIVTYANRSARRLWERASGDMIGRPAAEVCGAGFSEAGGMERLLGDDRETAVEIRCTTADGAAVSLLASATFLRDGLGDVRGAVLVAADISGQKRLEKTLEENRRALRNMVDNGQAGILLLDPQGTVREANEPFARNYGLTASDIVGRDLFSLFPEAVARERRSKFLQAMAAGVPMRYQDLHMGRYWEHLLTPIAEEARRVAGLTVFSLDVTDRVEAERARERLIGELSDALSQVKTLSGLIPICAHCKRIRGDDGYWQQVEQYVEEHTDADFSHGLCNDCIRTLYPELAREVTAKIQEAGPRKDDPR